MKGPPPVAEASVHWHDAECGSYTADLALWEQLASSAGRTVLDLGCGTGRVALHLARRGHEVVGVDVSGPLVVAFAERAGGENPRGVVGDVCELDLGRRFGLILAPMQLAQLLEDRDDRLAMLDRVAAHLEPGGVAALAIVETLPEAADGGPRPLPDVREVDGWVYSSLPLETVATTDALVVRRLRQLLSRDGEMSEAVDEVRLRPLTAAGLEDEASSVGLRPVGRQEIVPTPDHVGSTVVLLGGRA